MAVPAEGWRTTPDADPVLDGPLAGVCAHERVVRGEDLRGAGVPFADVFDVPLVLQAWEPPWPLATYGDNEVHAPRPRLPAVRRVRLPEPGERIADPEAEAALLAVVGPWVSPSNGRAGGSCVHGGSPAAGAPPGAAPPPPPRRGAG